jgi:hypothetical protein
MSAIVQIEREFLMSQLIVSDAKAAKFREQVTKTLPIFEEPPNVEGEDPKKKPMTLQWRLAISGVRDTGEGSGVYLHIWKLRKHSNLFTAMNFLATDPEYAQLHDCVTDERQHLLATENMYAPHTLDPIRAKKFVVESFQSPSDRAAVVRLQFGMGKLARDMLKVHGWRLLIALQHETGRLGKRVHVWGVETNDVKGISAQQLEKAKSALLESEPYKSTALLTEQPRKDVKRCRVASRFDDYDPVDYRA